MIQSMGGQAARLARAVAVMAAAAISVGAAGQSTLYGVTSGGDLYRINQTTGAGTLVGSSGRGCNAAASDSRGRIYIAGGSGGDADRLVQLDPNTGGVIGEVITSGRPSGFSVRGLEFGPNDVAYVVLSEADTSAEDLLARIDMGTGAYTVIGGTGRTDLQGLAMSPCGTLYGMGIQGGGTLVRLNTSSGAATVIGSGSLGGDTQALEFDVDGTLYSARDNLHRVSTSDGSSALVGPIGVSDLRGMALLPGTRLFALTFSGELHELSKATGAATLIGASGRGCNAASSNSEGRIFTGGGSGGDADRILELDANTGAVVREYATTGRPGGFGIRGMAFDASDRLYVVLSQADTTAEDVLARIDLFGTGAYTVIGGTGRTDLQGLAMSPCGTLYALGILRSGELLRVDTGTGATTLVGGGTMGGNTQALEFDLTGALYASRTDLLSVDPGNAQAITIGATGLGDIRGMALGRGRPPCYADCDRNGRLDIRDFFCFQARFAARDPYADCDGNTLFDIRDFFCFQARYAAGCP